jgi:hypothetical protein
MEEILTFNVIKTFESKQKKERSNIDYFAAHPQFWNHLPNETTQKSMIHWILQDGGIIKVKIPGYLHFFIKAIDTGTARNGAHILCGILARNRQQEDIAGAYLINPEIITKKEKLELLRNSDRYRVRIFPVQFTKEEAIIPKIKQHILHKEIKSLSFLDKEVF